MKRLLVFTIFFGFSCAGTVDVYAQAMVRGSVVDEEGQPLPDVDIEIQFKGKDPQTFKRQTNEKGGYVQVGIPSGRYVLVFTKEGYSSASIQSQLPAGLTELERVAMKPVQVILEAAPEVASDVAGEIQENFANAVEATRTGDMEQAETLYREILEIAPDLAEAHFNLGHVYREKKNWEAATNEFEKVIELQPERSDSYSALATIYNQTGRNDEARELLAQAGSRFQDDALLQFNLGVTFLNANESEQAAAAFKKALELDPSRVEAHFRLAQLAIGNGDIEEAISYLDTYRSGSGQNPANLEAAGKLLEALKPQ